MRSKSTTPTSLAVIVKGLVTLSQCAIEKNGFRGTILTRMPKASRRFAPFVVGMVILLIISTRSMASLPTWLQDKQ